MDQPNKNILNSNLFQIPLPLNPHRHALQRPLLTKHSEEEVLQSFKIKRNALMEALQAKKEVSSELSGYLCSLYYSLHLN